MDAAACDGDQYRRLAQRDPELFPDPLLQIREAPAHHLMDRRDRAALDDGRQSLTLGIVKLGPIARRLTVDQPGRTAGVEAQHPVADGLQPDPADPRRVSAGASVLNCRKRQKPPRLSGILRLLALSPQSERVKIIPKRNRSSLAEPSLWFASWIQNSSALGIPCVSPQQRALVLPDYSKAWYFSFPMECPLELLG